MKICPKCDLPTDICIALAYYRAATSAIQNREAEQAVYFLNSATECEQQYYMEKGIVAVPMMRISRNETLQ